MRVVNEVMPDLHRAMAFFSDPEDGPSSWSTC